MGDIDAEIAYFLLGEMQYSDWTCGFPCHDELCPLVGDRHGREEKYL